VAVNWFYARGGENFGPFSAGQLKELAASGEIERGDTVWKEGMTSGVLAARVQHLFADAPPAPRPEAVAAAPEPVEAAPPPESAEVSAPPAVLPEVAAPAEPVKAEKSQGQGGRRADGRPGQHRAREKRVLTVTGGTISSQDGEFVKFRKKCLRCGYMDTSMATMPIPNGHLRVNFFCPKCKKNQQTAVHGVG
jgi:hypothetical protein